MIKTKNIYKQKRERTNKTKHTQSSKQRRKQTHKQVHKQEKQTRRESNI